MFCIYCGKEIDSDSNYCCYCGGKQPIDYNPTVSDMIDNAGDEIGEGIDDVKENWKDYLTPDNMELLAVLVLVLPLFMGIVNTVTGPFFGLFTGIPLLGSVFAIFPTLIKLIFVLAAAAGVVSAVYLLMNNHIRKTTWSYITVAIDLLALFACLGVMLRWETVSIVLGLISLVFGLDCISRVIIQRKGIDSAPAIGHDLEAYKLWYENYRREDSKVNYRGEAGYVVDSSIDENSYFDGKGATLLGLSILTFLVSVFTFGLAAPWMICKIQRWKNSHTVIDGRRLTFTGRGIELLGHWILWELLSLVTCGIYLFFLHVALKRWEMKHTAYEDLQMATGQFDGNSFQYFGYSLLEILLLLISLGLAAPWTITMIQKWEMKHSIIATERLKYEGTALGILGQYIIVLLLSILTFGIYLPWGIVRLNKYIYSHTHVDK